MNSKILLTVFLQNNILKNFLLLLLCFQTNTNKIAVFLRSKTKNTENSFRWLFIFIIKSNSTQLQLFSTLQFKLFDTSNFCYSELRRNYLDVI